MTSNSCKFPSFDRKRLLLAATSASNLAELADMAKVLAIRGHRIVLLYIYSESVRHVHADAIVALNSLNGIHQRLTTRLIDLDSGKTDFVRRGQDAQATMHPTGRKYGKKFAELFGLLDKIRLEPLLRRWLDSKGWWLPLREFRRRLNIWGLVRFSTLHMALRVPPLVINYRAHLSVFRAFLKQGRYDAILVPEDVVGDVWPLLIKAGHKEGIPTIVFPYTLANQEEAFQSLRGELAYQSKYNRLAANLFPRWRKKADGADIVRLPASHILAHEWLRITPPDPWMMNSGYANVICVDSPSSRDYFVRGGIPADKLLAVGSVSQDSLYRQLRDKQEGLKELRRELGLNDVKPLLLISGCPNQLAGSVPYCQFSSIEEIADHVGRAVSVLRDSYHLVVRPHPNFPIFGELLKPWMVVSTMIPTAHLVPLSDLFIAFASATIRWAIACGVPTINYDVFHYGYGDFEMAKGVRTVADAEDFISALQQMEPGCEKYREAKECTEADATYWGMLDGRCAERIEEVIASTCDKSWRIFPVGR